MIAGTVGQLRPCSVRSARSDGVFGVAKPRLLPRSSLTRLQASRTEDAVSAPSQSQPISLSDDALRHLRRLREDSGGDELLLRVGVKAGGCSGMSYTMDFEENAKVSEEDTVMEYNGFKLVSDPMSLLYLFGMTLDYSNKLIGGGFIFQNPNAQSSCGCGKSFGV